jgi:hypothetical protein
MKELGHFPMSEHPERFRTYLLPVLEEIRASPGEAGSGEAGGTRNV